MSQADEGETSKGDDTKAPGEAANGGSKPPQEDEVFAEPELAKTEPDPLEVAKAETQKFREQLLRTAADFENFRKQSQKRQDDALVRSLGNLVEGLLPVLDACDAAIAHGSGDAVEPIATALYRALEKEGLERIDPAGGPFDPAEADAVMHVPGEGGAHVVAETMRAGYRWRGRVLRPAMVKVTD